MIRIIAVSILIGLLSPFFLTSPPLVTRLLASCWGVLYSTYSSACWSAVGPCPHKYAQFRKVPQWSICQPFSGNQKALCGFWQFSIWFPSYLVLIWLPSLPTAALSAVLMLVFKDSILGFVASIQLSNNDMVGWGIGSMPKWCRWRCYRYLLATIKVMNFDKTVTTIPPYSLIADSFQNWRFMREAGGRRVRDLSLLICKPFVMPIRLSLKKNKICTDTERLHQETATREIEIDNSSRGSTDSFYTSPAY